MKRLTTILITAGAGLALVAGGTAAGAAITGHTDSSDMITVCYDGTTHNFVPQDAGTTCPANMTATSWNQTGPAAPAGPAGATGATGSQGSAGQAAPAGPAGPAGATGSQGPAGQPGATGSQGPAGQPGATGSQGPAGQPGATGSQGPAGQPGATGSQGPAGQPGATGSQGPAGQVAPAGSSSVGTSGPALPPDLSVTNIGTPNPAAPGNKLTYTITAASTGGQAAAGVTVTDALPASVYFDSAAAQGTCTHTPGTHPPGTPALNLGGTVTCNIGSLGADGSATVTIVVTALPGTVSNTATVSGSGITADADDTATTTATVTVTATTTGPVSYNIVTRQPVTGT